MSVCITPTEPGAMGALENRTAEASFEPPRALSRRGLENVVAFARLLGYVRHFHPSDQAAQTSWEAFAVAGIRRVEDCADLPALIQALNELFEPIAPTLQIFPAGAQPSSDPRLAPSGGELKVVSWQHWGAGQVAEPSKGRESIYQSHRAWFEAAAVKSPGAVGNPVQPFVGHLGLGLAVAVPLALYADAQGTLPHAGESKHAVAQDTVCSGNDRATRLAAVVLGWNVLQHFYPYFDVVNVDWLGELPKALAAAAMDCSETEFLHTLLRMIAALHDGHANVTHDSERDFRRLPIAWRWIDDRLVITAVAPEASSSDIKIGDVVVSIDGKPSAEAIEVAEQLVSAATPQWKRLCAIARLSWGAAHSCARLQTKRGDGPMREVVLARTGMSMPREPRPPIAAELGPAIRYFDLCRGTDAEFEAELPQLASARGVIFDLRGYPKASPKFLQHLSHRPLRSAMWQIPLVSEPDHPTLTYLARPRWQLEPLLPRIAGNIVVLTDERAISYTESLMGIIEAHHLATIVGSTTAGTNGNVNLFTLPGHYCVSWTGMRVVKHDGSEHHGIGIHPNVPSLPTLEGIAQGRDEVLERAIAVVNA